jgi:hypothetical protein
MTINRTTLTGTTISVIVVAVTVPPDVALLYVVTENVIEPFFYFLKIEIVRIFKSRRSAIWSTSHFINRCIKH